MTKLTFYAIFICRAGSEMGLEIQQRHQRIGGTMTTKNILAFALSTLVVGCAAKPDHPTDVTVNRVLRTVAEHRAGVELDKEARVKRSAQQAAEAFANGDHLPDNDPPKAWIVTIGKQDDLPQGAVPVTRNDTTCAKETVPICSDEFSSTQMSYLSAVVCTTVDRQQRLILMPTFKRDDKQCWQLAGDYTRMNGNPRMPLGFSPGQPSRMPNAFGTDNAQKHVVVIYK